MGKKSHKRFIAKAKRELFNQMANTVKQDLKRKYDGASKSRHHSDWLAGNSSANMEVNEALVWLRNRSRDLGRNNPYARKAFRTIPNNVIGTGIIPTPVIKAKSEEKWIKEAWKVWGEKIVCDYDQRYNFYGIQRLALRTMLESGECLIRRVRASSNYKVPLRLQVLEADYIDTSKHDVSWRLDRTTNEKYLDYYGIRFNRYGERVGYWLYSAHPSEFLSESKLVPASDIIHLYEAERSGQMRGVPFTASVMLRLRDLDDYEFTERIRNKIAACFSVFITDDSEDDSNTDADELEKMEPGAIQRLAPGKSVTIAQPPSHTGYKEYVGNNLHGIAAGLGVTYENLTGDFSNVNFSSGRMGWIEFAREVEHLQWNIIIPQFCERAYEWFVEAAKLAGYISMSTSVEATWTAPRREMIDPYKEIQAIKLQLRSGLISWSEVVKMFGYIPDQLKEELKKDAAMWDELQLLPESDPRFDSNRQTTEVDKDLMKD